MEAFARDLGHRLDNVERHVVERSYRVEQMLEDMGKRWDSFREHHSGGHVPHALPDQLKELEQSLHLKLDKFGSTIEGHSQSVEQLMTRPVREDIAAVDTHSGVPSAPSFGDAHAHDELDGVVMSLQEDDYMREWLSHVERHLQQIHSKLEEMSLQSNNLHVKMNTVHAKVSDTASKMSDHLPSKVNEKPEKEKYSSMYDSVKMKENDVKVMSAAPTPSPGMSARVASSPSPISTAIVPQKLADNTDTPTSAKPPSDERQELVHALHGAMGLKGARRIKPHAPKSRENWQKIANSKVFQILSVAAIVLNGIMTGIESDFEVGHLLADILYREGTTTKGSADIDRTLFRVPDVIFIIFWCFEIIVHAGAQGSDFANYHNPMARWNGFDILCVLISILELMSQTLKNIGRVPGLGVLRLMRVFRVVRVLRVVKYVKAFSGVRKLVIAVSGALLTLFWALVLLALLLYVFSIMLTSGVAQYYESVDIQSPAHTNITIIPPPGFEEKSHTEVIRFFYGGIFETMATLFQAITGGDWTVSANSVLPLNWTFYILWYGYIAFVLFGLLNVFTGIFVESATHAANADREIKIQAQMEEESSYLNQIRVIFARSDTDGSGKMTETELQELMTQEDFKEQMECLGIHSTEAHGLFKLLDDDGSGSVSIDEFLSGCIRLKGTAKAVDMITLLFETNKLNRKVGKILRCITDGGGQIDCSPPSGAASNAGDDDSANGKSAPSSPRMLPRSMSQISF